jgi:hypothetical protein
MSKVVMPDLIRHPALFWIPAFAGMTVLAFMFARVIKQSEAIPKNGDCFAYGCIILPICFMNLP